ncbi:MAG TPA: dienelactone hydrolase family protein, partial [Thermoanaerobaculia bacterium]|nr:dienelactone hydrolase family protein [Thermoanaerobaculia bacterium]
RLGLFGHGHGGGAAILAGGEPPWRDRVRALVTWAAVADADVLAAAGEVRAPWLIVHGGEDKTVSSEAGRRLAGLAQSTGGEHELLVVPGAGHTFGSRHPFAGPTPQLIQALNATQRWFRAHL